MILAQMHYGVGFPPNLSMHGAQIDSLIDIVHVFALALFVGWGAFFVYCLVKFRYKGGHTAMYQPIKAKLSKVVEVAVVVVEAVLLLAFSMPVWAAYKNDPPAKDKRLEIRATGEQFQWDFHYAGKDGVFGRTRIELMNGSNPIGLDDSDPAAADDIWLINECHLPTDRDIYVRITSKDVIHSFAIPTMRVKQDAIPGMQIPVWFKIKPDATTDKLKEELTIKLPIDKVNWYKHRHHVAISDYKDKDGDVILAKDQGLGNSYAAGKETIDKLKAAGVGEVVMQPANPLEIVCAQLCGNSHFKMKAQLITHTPENFDKWVEEKSKKPEVEFGF